MSWEDLSRVALNAPALPGVTPETLQLRSYPFGADFAHVIGYVGRVSEADLEAAGEVDPLLTMPGFKIGKLSIERAFAPQLRGVAGTLAVEVNSSGRVMRSP